MVRIFLALAFLSVGLLVANLVSGFLVGDWNGVSSSFREQQAEVTMLKKSSSLRAKKDLAELLPGFSQASREFNEMRSRQIVHFLLGVLATLVAILINSISVTYFIGTSRWCQEVSDTYRLGDKFVSRSRRLKRKTFPWSLCSILLVLAVATLGAASDPAGNSSNSAGFVSWHMLLAVMTTCFVGWSFLVQVGAVGANFEIIDEILTSVKSIREERGLDPDA